MARRLFGLDSKEVLLGATRHAARALGLGSVCGALEPGLAADFAIWSVETLDELGYWVGFNPCHAVVVGGELVHERID
jgi:imidazolonepropionase